MKSSLHITNNGHTIRAKGAAAQALFDALTSKLEAPALTRKEEAARRRVEFDLKHGSDKSSVNFQPKPLPQGGYGKGTLK